LVFRTLNLPWGQLMLGLFEVGQVLPSQVVQEVLGHMARFS
jgi:hypothetical protein